GDAAGRPELRRLDSARSLRPGDSLSRTSAARREHRHQEVTTMRVRHRIPSVFSLSMVDVMCCALGCVILLWLLNLKDVKDKIGSGEAKIATDEANLAAGKRENAEQKAALDELATQLAHRSARILYLNDKVRKEQMRSADLDNRLTAGTRRVEDLESRLAAG